MNPSNQILKVENDLSLGRDINSRAILTINDVKREEFRTKNQLNIEIKNLKSIISVIQKDMDDIKKMLTEIIKKNSVN